MGNFQKSLNALAKSRVYVGIPAKAATRKNPEINNAELVFLLSNGVRTVDARRRMGAMMLNRKIDYSAALKLYLHSKGSALFAIPPRPIIEPAINASGNKERIVAQLKLAGEAALKGNEKEMTKQLNRAGLLAQNIVRAWFTDPRNHWAPNAPSTIQRKGSSRPNIDTGELRKSITYLVVNG